MPPVEVRDEIMFGVRQAVAECDVLGFPSVYRVIRDLPAPRKRYGSTRKERALIRLYYALGRSIPVDGKVLTEERCHRSAIDTSFLTELVSLAQSVVVVSCWPILESRFPVAINHILVPPERAVKDTGDETLLFEIYPDIVHRIRAVSSPGTLVLVGAGIIGKIFVGQAREAGAVALDVGSLLDYMVGMKTRTIADVI
jgi:hypothetical protein